MKLCGACGSLARHARSPAIELRGRPCPRWDVVHRGCCARETCSDRSPLGVVRCAWWRGGRERVEAAAFSGALDEPAECTSPK